jgi:hypothetical protein
MLKLQLKKEKISACATSSSGGNFGFRGRGGPKKLCHHPSKSITLYCFNIMRVASNIINVIACLFLLISPAVSKSSSVRSALKQPTSKASTESLSITAMSKTASNVQIPAALKLVIGAGGIYGAFLYYGTLQEEVFHYTSADGSKFKAAWFLQALGKSHTC